MNKIKRTATLLSLFGIFGFIFFYIMPYISVAGFAIVDSSGGSMRLTIDNFRSVLNNEYFRSALGNTLTFTFLCIPLTLILAYLIVCIPYKWHSNWTVMMILFMPALIPSASVAPILDTLFPQIGLLEIVVLFIIKNIGLICIVFKAGLLRIPDEIFEAANIDGTNGFGLHLYILFPIMIPYILIGALIGLIQSFRIFREVYLLFGEYPPDSLYMMPHWIFNKFNKMNYAELSAGTMVFTVCIICILILIVSPMLFTRRKRG